MNLTLTRQIIHDGKVFVYAEGGGFMGWVPSPMALKAYKPYMDWVGGKIPMATWKTILAFFKKHKTDEVQVRLYYNPTTKEWRPHAFPQDYPSGMATRELPNHPNMTVDSDLFPHPWLRMGSVHHHCSASAFQSGTDRTDEETVCGIHITVGKLNDPKWEIHTRISVRIPGALDAEGKLLYGPTQTFYDAELSQWFDIPQSWKDVLPMSLHMMALKEEMLQPPGDEIAFPTRWEENLIRRAQYPNGQGGMHASGMYDPRNSIPHYHGSSASNHGGTGMVSPNFLPPNQTELGLAIRMSQQNQQAKWQTLTVPVLDSIQELIEVYSDKNGNMRCQVVETMGWAQAKFVSLLALESVLRAAGFHQFTPHVWGFAQDKAMIESALNDMAEDEAKREAEEAMNTQAYESALATGVDAGQ